MVDTILNVPPLVEICTKQDEDWCQAKYNRQAGARRTLQPGLLRVPSWVGFWECRNSNFVAQPLDI